MNQNYGIQPFEFAKNKISESANKLYKYLILMTVIGIFLAVIMIITFFVLLVPLGFTFEDFDPSNIYTTGEAIYNSGILTTGLIAVIFLGIFGIALIVILIMSYIQYYKLGSAFSRLHVADPIITTTRYISYGFYGYIIALIASIFIPGIGSTVVSILGNVALAVAAYLIYKLFIEFKSLGRFKGKPSYYLFLGLAINVVTSISAMYSTWGSFGSFIGFILMLLGFRDLSRDIRTVTQPGGQAPQTRAPLQSSEVSTIPISDTKVTEGVLFCIKCGTKIEPNMKFCSNCGSSI
ncbi:MAG: zinc ribbon domain-containing protein [Candidatus Heimdallarchaeaceae archaeon]